MVLLVPLLLLSRIFTPMPLHWKCSYILHIIFAAFERCVPARRSKPTDSGTDPQPGSWGQQASGEVSQGQPWSAVVPHAITRS